MVEHSAGEQCGYDKVFSARELAAAKAEAKLAGELAMREAATGHCLVPSFAGSPRCECGKWFNQFHPAAVEEWKRHIRNLPLTPDSADVLERKLAEAEEAGYAKSRRDLEDCIVKRHDDLERIKRAERARGAEEAYQRIARNGTQNKATRALCEQWAAEQAAIADGKGDES